MSGLGRSRKGAWIEIPRKANVGQYISSRSRKGAWIEIALNANYQGFVQSLPQGSVD